MILHLYKYGIMEKQMAISALAALAQETRLDVFRTLVKRDRRVYPPVRLAPLSISHPQRFLST